MQNREIKFRAWDKDKKCFIPNDVWAVLTTDFSAFGIMLRDWENYREGEYFYKESQELMQYTGLKDKNGKKIYEGDVVKINSLTGQVIYDPAIFRIANSTGDFITDGYPSWEICEIIGNIFENPELLGE